MIIVKFVGMKIILGEGRPQYVRHINLGCTERICVHI